MMKPYNSQSWNAFCDAIRQHEAALRQVRLGGKLACVRCKTKVARSTSLYCSEKCKQAFLTFEEVA